MQPTSFPGAFEICKPNDMTDEQCMSIWGCKGIDSEEFPYWLTAWKPSYEDLQALNRGEPIYIKSICHQLIPMAVFTLDENGECNDAC